jgi:hypothetical protein
MPFSRFWYTPAMSAFSSSSRASRSTSEASDNTW